MSDWVPANAVITGGASGIGFAIAQRLAGRGVRVMLADLPGERLDEAAAGIEGALAQPCDVSDPAQVDTLADAAFDRLGTVELLLNNAGAGGPRGRLWEVDPAEARRHFDVNVWGVWHGCRAFAPRMIDQDVPGAIYNTGSENSFFCAAPQTAAYIAGKHAVLGLTESMREDLPDHVHAGTIVPGWVFTPFGDARVMQHGMDVGEYADLVVPQLLARRRFVVSHRSNLKRIDERMDELRTSYSQFGSDDDNDVRDAIARLTGG
ncbi:SDR family NAD(P)-dependent oxidoreductase [Erythrobacter sp.]|uniref:SDR family NAD(P)-dependent oxidoreductase n=1 Tax=Erythrobacter sp. TaxID=1042 RepID=UPI001B086B19|nr:SDR family NAD(P)-dependent oxidoreductase [Erythrobacter sp.]MBO6525848.1 SDR family NAD(P)-dependent oxidoreductase [Erythrobacter sp.]MBO6529477.1 SDR family NAD(P)-dependent oxidoreductase [Erythrobacter sp.]